MSIEKDYKDEIDLKEILDTLLNYKKSIFIFIVLGGMISGYIAYFKPNIYKAQTLLKITFDRQGYYDDFLMTTSSGVNNSALEDELIVFGSEPIAQRAIKKLNLGTRYFKVEHYKEIELYHNTPFTVEYSEITPNIYGKKFILQPINDKRFLLILKSEDDNWLIAKVKKLLGKDDNNHFYFSKVCRYGDKIENEFFTLKVDKIFPLTNKEYKFSIIPDKDMAWFIQQGIKAQTLNKYGSIVSLNFYDTVSLRASEIVNAVAQAYIEQNLELKSEGAKKQLRFIDMQLDAINKTLQGSSKKLQKYKATNIVVDLSNKANITANKLSELESKKYELNMQLQILQSMMSHIKHTNKISELNLDYTPTENKNIASLIEQIQLQMAKYSTMSVRYTDKHPNIIKIKKEIMFLVKSLKKTLQDSISIIKKHLQSIEISISEQEAKLKSVPKQEQELESLTRHFMVNEKIYSYLLEKRAETAILASSTISNTRVIQKAKPSYLIVKPKRKLIVIVGLILGFIFGVLQAFIRNYFEDTIKNQEEIEKNIALPIYANLPLIKNKQSVPQYMESIRTLWVNLSFLGDKNSSKLIAVSSSISGEGKTFTIYNLSRVLSKSTDKRIIVVDMDMRRSSLHEKFGITNTNKGLSTFLSEHFSLDEVIQPTSVKNLDIITSGPKAPNPTKLIMSDRFDEMIDKLKEKYDYILIDTPPIGIVSDSMKVMFMADLVLYIIKINYSKKEVFKTINDLSKGDKINFGIVLNGIDFEKSYYHHGYNKEYTKYYIEEKEEYGT